MEALVDYSYNNQSVGGNDVAAAAFASSGGGSYGDAFSPTTWGSGGGAGHKFGETGGAGGGAMRLVVGGVLRVDGAISANGEATLGGGGGGSGGSVWVEYVELQGNGSISANGGAAASDVRHYGSTDGSNGGGGGGGGRVAVQGPANVGSARHTNALGWHGTIEARAGVERNSTLATYPRFLGTVVTDTLKVVTRVTSQEHVTAQSSGALDLELALQRRGVVQKFEAWGTGNGTTGATDEHDAIVRGTWRLAFKRSTWSEYMTTQATAEEVRQAIRGLADGPGGAVVGDVSVSRDSNTQGTGWAWRVTFHNDVGSLSLMQVNSLAAANSTVHDENGTKVGSESRWVADSNVAAVTPVLLRCDSSLVYSTNVDAAMATTMIRDAAASNTVSDASTTLGQQRSNGMVKIEPEYPGEGMWLKPFTDRAAIRVDVSFSSSLRNLLSINSGSGSYVRFIIICFYRYRNLPRSPPS